MAKHYLIAEFKIFVNGEVVENDFFSMMSSTSNIDDFIESAQGSILDLYSSKYTRDLMFIRFFKVEEISKDEFDRVQTNSIYKKVLTNQQ